MDGNGDDCAMFCMVKVIMASPDTNHLKTGFFQGFYDLLSGGSREFHISALTVFMGTVTSMGIGRPSFLQPQYNRKLLL